MCIYIYISIITYSCCNLYLSSCCYSRVYIYAIVAVRAREESLSVIKLCSVVVQL